MSNIFPLFPRMEIESPAGAEGQVTMAITNIFSLTPKLAKLARELSRLLDAIDDMADSVQDRDAK
jgi:hypothetical protein